MPKIVYKGLEIRGAMSIDQNYLYTISDSIKNENYSVKKFLKDGTHSEEEVTVPKVVSGLYVYDVDAMLNGKI